MNGISLTGRIDQNASILRERLTLLGEQVSTGRKGSSYAVLDTDAPKSMDLRGEITRRGAYQSAISQTLSKIQVTQDVLDRIAAIADKFAADTASLMGVTRPEAIQVQAGQARAALKEVANLLNEKFNGDFLFGGSNAHQPPIPDPDNILTSGMAVGIATEVASLTPTNAATVLANTKALAQSDVLGVTPFSVFISTGPGATEGRRNVLSGDGQRIDYGLFANRNGSVISSGETTGSWARDLMRGLASIAALTPGQTQLGQGYTDLVTTVQQGLKSAVNALALERGSLGVVEESIQSKSDLHERVTLTLTLQVSDVEEVDMAKTITSFQATQTQLEASYRAIAIAQQLSLTRFL
ncbi:MAG: flagellin [Roseomonas sp.]|nr:flagellin [Roseomonas sp.]